MTKRYYGLLVAGFVSIALLAGCASTGNESIRHESGATIKNKVVEGKTTKADIQSMFGAPTSTSFTDSGLEVWTYDFTKLSADAVSYIPVVNWFGSSATGTKKSLVVMYDSKDIVQRYSLSTSPVSKKTGIFNN